MTFRIAKGSTTFAFIAFGASIVWLFGVALSGYSHCVVAADMLLKAPNGPIPREYFGFHMHRGTATTPWPSVPFGSWRLIDAYVTWPDLEPQKGKWNFELLDKYVTLADSRKTTILLPLAFSPSWASARPHELSAYRPGNAAEPRNMADWRDYVKTVARRYKGKIHQYEIWNEPNLEKFYTGNIEQMVSLAREAYRILKEVDPANIVVSPSLTGDDKNLDWFNEYLTKGGAQYADVIGYHFYTGQRPPEAMLPLIDKVRRIMDSHGIHDKPLWNTETGWLISSKYGNVNPRWVDFPREWKALPMDIAAAYIARAFILGWAAGLQRYYWYAWDNKAMGLMETSTRSEKPASAAVVRAVRWLEGAVVKSCNYDGTLWICYLSRANHGKAWLVWNPQGTIAWRPFADWGVTRYETLDGTIENVNFDTSLGDVTIGPAPILFETDNSSVGSKS